MIKNCLLVLALLLLIGNESIAQLSLPVELYLQESRKDPVSYTDVLTWPDTVKISGVTIQGQQTSTNHSFTIVSIDSLALRRHESSNIGELLKESSNVFIKSYGQGGLATPSFRGTGASHTQVLWNGVALNSPMLGQTDFSMVPVFFTDQLTVYQSGSALGKGSSLPGGSILFENLPRWEVKHEANLSSSIGSFGYKGVFAGVRTTRKHLHLSAKLFMNEATNDFSFKNTALSKTNPPNETRVDAGYSQKAALIELYNQLNSKNQLTLRTWLQQTHRQVPQPMIVLKRPGNEYQDQSFIRTMANWDYFGTSMQVNTTASWFYEDFFYRNIISEISSHNFTNSLQLQSTAHLKVKYLGKVSFSGRLDGHFVNSSNYNEQKTQLIHSYNVHLYRDLNLFGEFKLGFQAQILDGKRSPLLPSLGYKVFVLKPKSLFITASIAGTYHSPSLNDLYWVPGGNPMLQPEKGFTSELGFGFDVKDKWFKTINLNVVGFYSRIHNLIIWLPDSVFTYWKPYNMKAVSNKGMEVRFSSEKVIGSLNCSAIANYTFTIARTTDGISADDASIGKQLIYTPQHTLNTRIVVSRNQVAVFYLFEYVGKRFTSSDNTRYMPAYCLHHATLGYAFKFLKIKTELQFQVNNILNSSYQSIAWQPMPGRNFRLSLKFNLSKK